MRVSNKLGVIVMRYDKRIDSLIPHAKTYERNGDKFHLVPNKPTETKLLTNLGYAPPSTISTRYQWGNTTPFFHQRKTAELLVDNRRAYVLNGMGTGKTRATLYALDFLMQQNEIRKAIVVAPLSTLTTVWENEVFGAFPHLTTAALHGTKAKRLQKLGEDVDIYIINHDGVHTILDELLARGDIDAVVIDELAAFRNARTRRWKAVNKLISGRKYAWGLTGLPTPNAPTDAWAECRLLTPDNVPKYFRRFQQETMYQVTQFKWVPRKEANDIVFNAMQPAVRYATDDCVDLPPTTFSTRECELTPDQKKVYKDMVNNFYAQFQGGEVNAVNEGVKLSKLLQICSGFAYTKHGSITIDAKPRLQVLEEIIDESEQKVIVFVPFTKGVDIVHQALSNRGISTGFVYGDTPKRVRDSLFNQFGNSINPKVLVAHPGTMAHGLNLVSASTIVWYSPTNSYEVYDQANARIVRPGQKYHTHIINIESSPVEKRVYDRLSKKQKVQGMLLDMFKGQHPLIAPFDID